jgi:hypothetical protein
LCSFVILIYLFYIRCRRRKNVDRETCYDTLLAPVVPYKSGIDRAAPEATFRRSAVVNKTGAKRRRSSGARRPESLQTGPGAGPRSRAFTVAIIFGTFAVRPQRHKFEQTFQVITQYRNLSGNMSSARRY